MKLPTFTTCLLFILRQSMVLSSKEHASDLHLQTPSVPAGNDEEGHNHHRMTQNQSATLSCTTYPDPHFLTWQNVAYDFHDGCDVIFLRSENVEIHLRLQKNTVSSSWSNVQNVAVKITAADGSSDILEAKTNKDQHSTDWGFYINDPDLTTPYDQDDMPTQTAIGGWPFEVYQPTAGSGLSYYGSYIDDDSYYSNPDLYSVRISLPAGNGYIEITKLNSYGLAVVVQGSGDEFNNMFSDSEGMCSGFATTDMLDRGGDAMPFTPSASYSKRFPEVGNEWQVKAPGSDNMLLSDINDFPLLSGTHNAYPVQCNDIVATNEPTVVSIGPSAPPTELPSTPPSGMPSQSESQPPSESPTMPPTNSGRRYLREDRKKEKQSIMQQQMQHQKKHANTDQHQRSLQSTCDFCQNLWDPIQVANCEFDASMLSCDVISSTITIYDPAFANYFTTPLPETDIDCVNNNEFEFSTSSASTAAKVTCRWIRMKEQRRSKYCQYQTVVANCPLSCGVCCEDDPSYTFDISFEKNGSKTKDCDWLSKKARRQEKWCGENDDSSPFKRWQNGQMIRDACPKACNYCVE